MGLIRSTGNWAKGIGEALIGRNAGKVEDLANQALKSQHHTHLMHLGVGAIGASGLAGMTYIKGKAEGRMNKHASEIDNYLHTLSDDSKRHLLKKIKVKKGNLYNKDGK